jgi:hypothetical protein
MTSSTFGGDAASAPASSSTHLALEPGAVVAEFSEPRSQRLGDIRNTHDRSDPVGTRASAGIEQQQELDHVLVDRRSRRLHHVSERFA